jgi:hypothetical protein
LSELADRLRGALAADSDADALTALLAEEVEWLGARGGACRGPDEVLAVVRPLLEGKGNVQSTGVQVVGAGLLVELGLSSGQPAASDRWLGVMLADRFGRIVRMQDYESRDVAEHDLEALAGARAGSGPPATGASVVDLVPFVHVADVVESVAFYRLLGLEVRETYEPTGRLQWAFLGSEQAALMLAAAGEPVEPRHQAVLFYLYSHDLGGLRTHLLASGVLPSEILDGSPGPRQEMRVTDPDGYCLIVAQIESHPIESHPVEADERPGEPR